MEALFKEIGSTVLQQWGIIIIVAIVLILMTRNLSVVPKGKSQSIIELFVEGISNWTKNTMGDKYTGFAAYIGALVLFLFFMNITDLIGLRPPTADYSVALVLSLTTFLMVQINAIIKNGGFGYLKGYIHPSPALLPINILERVMLPVTLSFRLFGNITVGVVIVELLLQALGNLTWFAQLAIPVPFMAYFDLFDGFLQTFIFTILTMIYIKMTAEE
ncbi:F0F1 ATP synthase subunit A [Clostridium sardiniense]|uniref:ATP synthase subunit a n=1 Tax=Clostridium sardiniense TaxID=29369 RepID=A0ABS7KY46_CLOSR|nr:F0F1 ATP synthase subunit A [Clostridium sardiniense]MBM7835379.1 F-type H+-transporting ATPase subunit a [Clostridium sardiniense]MBY0755738.1 F0F1 ATP synthase subunit A [Clostridium sardiniense]MDQ0460035.1 F-type H+-transporting ATPase subunit a [Clostridium sardiniense]